MSTASQESYIEQNMHMAHKFNLLEVALFESYVFVFGLIIAQLFPKLLSVNIWIYAFLCLLGAAYTYWAIFHNNKHLTEKLEIQGWHAKILKKFEVKDFTIYKLTIILSALIVCQIFPALLTLHIAWLIAFAMFGLGYFIALMTHHTKLYHKK